MTLPQQEMTLSDVTSMWRERHGSLEDRMAVPRWGVPHAERIRFKAQGRLGPRDLLPLAPTVILLEAVGSVLTSLEGAFRTRHLELRSLRSCEAMRLERCMTSVEAFSWPSWMPEQARW